MAVEISNLRRAGTAGIGAALRWRLNRFFTRRPRLLNLLGARLTVFDAFGAPGDTLLTAIVCRHIRERFPRIRLNILTPNPELVRHDPNVGTVNEAEDFFCLWHWYLDLLESKNENENVLRQTLGHLGIRETEYRARVFLTSTEIENARQLFGARTRPVFAFNTLSREPVKNWPQESWRELLEKLRAHFDLLHLGDGRELEMPAVRRFAGRLDLRGSMAMLSLADIFAGPDSFLMHAANGLDMPSVIIFGGSRTPENVGYAENENLFTKMPCGPCWIHENRGEHCGHDIECLRKISVEEVFNAVMKIARNPKPERRA